MIETIAGFPDNVVACAAKGHVTGDDYDRVLIPAVERALATHDKIRCYYELGAEFAGMDAGAAWRDFTVGMGHLTRWERVAVVTDVDWIGHAVNAFRFLMPGAVRVFPNSAKAEARTWVAATGKA
jgi:SpoIIAA-like